MKRFALVLMGMVAVALPASIQRRARASERVCHPTNCSTVCGPDVNDPGRQRCERTCTDMVCTGGDDGTGGSGGGNPGEPGPGGGGGGAGGNGGQDCSQCPADGGGDGSGGQSGGDAPMYTPIRANDSCPGICRQMCKNKAAARGDNCRAQARSMMDACNQSMAQVISQMCTSIVSYTPQNISPVDISVYAPDVCSTRDYHSLAGQVIWANDQCRRDVATAKTSEQRSECNEDMMDGTGPYWNNNSWEVSVNTPIGGFKVTVGGKDGQGASGRGFCLGQERSQESNCAAQQQCETSKCSGSTAGCGSGGGGGSSGGGNPRAN